MTIGDEKVVKLLHNYEREAYKHGKTDENAIATDEAFDVLRSAYAELAADRDLYLEQAASNETGRMAEWHRAELFAEQLQAAESQLAELRGKRDSLRAFANDVMEDWWEGDLDGGSRQDIAERHGLIAPITVTEACGDSCVCAEVDAFPLTCYRRTELLTGKLAAADGATTGETK